MRPDKKAIVDEIWDEQRIQGFIDKAPMGSEPDDFSALLFAYRSMRPEDFGRFLELYRAAGRDVNARSRGGKTLVQTISTHTQAAPFIALLQGGAT